MWQQYMKFTNRRKIETVFEIIGQVLQVWWAMLKSTAIALWENLDTILELKKFLGYFTPAGMIALCIGVPTFVVSVVLWVAKRAIKNR